MCTRLIGVAVSVLFALSLATGTPAQDGAPQPNVPAPQEQPVPDPGEADRGQQEATPPDAGATPQDQQEDTLLGKAIEKVFVTATLTPRVSLDVPRSVNIVDEHRIRARGVLSIVDALDDQPGIWVEKRAAHTSDPVIRGLSGANLLALIDMNTLSTFWGEGGFAGDDMYGKIDPGSIERIEVVRGPSSVLYGSNALGGVLNFITRSSPFDYREPGEKAVFGGRSFALVSTAPSMWRFRQEFYGAAGDMRWLVGVSHWDAGSTRDGGGQDQSPAGGHGTFFDGHFDFRLAPDVELTLTYQHAGNDQVGRYYRPTQWNSNRRDAVALRLTANELDWGFADEAIFGLYYQHKQDRRFWYASPGPSGPLTMSGTALWNTVQAWAHFNRYLGAHTLTYGIDIQSTDGESPDDEQFTETPVGGMPVKPSPDSIWSSAGIFIQDEWALSEMWTLIGSARFDVFRFKTTADPLYVPPGGLPQGADIFTDWQVALIGGLQILFHVDEQTTIFGGWTRGFRQFAPIFGLTQHGYGILAPTRLLDPVTADQFELGVKHADRWFAAEAAVYYTRFENFQNIVRGTFQGLDWYDFNGNLVRDADEDIYVTSGNGSAYVYGIEAAASLNLAALDESFFGESWTVSGGIIFNFGNDTTNGIPIRHTQPLQGYLGLRYDHPDPDLDLWAEVQAQFVNDYRRIPPSRLSGDVGYLVDPQVPGSGMLRPYGLPGYTVFDFRMGLDIGDNVTVNAGVDNIFDKLYRTAHSRWDAPGRSFWTSVEVTF